MERLEIVEHFFLLTKANGTPPSINMLAKEVVAEDETCGTLVDQTEIQETRRYFPGINIFSKEDELVLLELRQQDP